MKTFAMVIFSLITATVGAKEKQPPPPPADCSCGVCEEK